MLLVSFVESINIIIVWSILVTHVSLSAYTHTYVTVIKSSERRQLLQIFICIS